MAGLPRAIIKKYGVTKKAWSVYRGTKSTSTTKRRRVSVMGRRKRFGRRSKGGSKLFGLSTKGLVGGLGVMGVLGAALFSDQIASMIPINVPYKQYGVAFAVGGPAGLVAKVGKDYLLGNSSAVGSNNAW